MTQRKISILFIASALLITGGCKTLNTDLKISERKIPSSFNTITNETTSVAEINWREYFDDKSLIALIDTALANNLDLQITLQQIITYKSQVKLIKAAQAPSVSANANFWQRKFGFYTMDDAGNRVTEFSPGDTIPKHLPDYFVGLTSTWEIDYLGKINNQKKAAIANFLASVEGKNYVVSNLIAEISLAYYELLSLDNEREIVKQTIQKQQDALEVINLQKEAGKTNSLAVQQFQGQLLQSQIMEQEISQQIILVENGINFLLGRYPQAIYRDNASLFKSMPQQLSTGIPSQLLARRPDIREAEYKLESSKYNLRTSKALFFPSFNIIGSVGFQAYKPTFLFAVPKSIMYSALGGLAAPVINRKAIHAQFANAKANQLAAMYHYQNVILNGYVEVANELSKLENLKKVYSLKKLQSDLLVESVETSNELYKSAKANYLEVLLAQQNSLQTQLELIDVIKRQKMATVNVYKALGGGWR